MATPVVKEQVNHTLPKVKGAIVGKVISVSAPFAQGVGKRVAITIQTKSEKEASSMVFGGVSTQQYDKIVIFVGDKVGNNAKIGGNATFVIEERTANVTEYQDKDKVWHKHTTNHCAINGFPTFETDVRVAETKAINQGKFDWLQEIGISKEDALDTVKSRISF